MAWVGHIDYTLGCNVFWGFLFILSHGTKASHQETGNWGPINHTESSRSHFNEENARLQGSKGFGIPQEQYKDMSNLNVLLKQSYFRNLFLLLSNNSNFANKLLDIQKLVTQ
jgi:hypothetical protein